MKVERNLPANIKVEHLPYFKHQLEINLPDTGFTHIRGYYALFVNGIVISFLQVHRQSLLYDKRLQEIGGVISLAKSLLKNLLCNKFSLRRGKRHETTIINEWSNNYFHWFTEALPKLMVVLEAGFSPVVLLPIHYKSAYQIDSLTLLGADYQTYTGKMLIGRNLLLPNRLAPYSAQYNPAIMKRLVSLLKEKLTLEKRKKERIYISRRSAAIRKVKNEEMVISLLKEYDFHIVELEGLSFEEQMAIMHRTEILVSIHGAGLTNMIFCEPGTKILEFSLENETMDKCYFNLANAMELIYYYQFCSPADNAANYQSSDLFIDLQELGNNMNKIIEGLHD